MPPSSLPRRDGVTPPPRTRLTADERRRQIVDSARRLFSTQAAGAVSMEMVAREAGVTTSLLYHYFKGKHDLHLSVLREMFRSAVPIPEYVVGATVQERLSESTDRWLDMVWADRHTWLAAMGAEGLGRDAEVEALLDRVREAAVDNIIAVLGIGPGPEVAPEVRAALRGFGGLAEASTREWLERDRLTREQLHTLLVHTLLALVDDVLPRLSEPPCPG